MTTQATHTSGPWAVDYEGPAHLSIEDEAGRVLALCNLQNEDGDEDEANAHLIASAPELLEALRVIAADGERDGWIPSYHWGEAQKAIAKAEGRAGQ